MNWYNKIIKIFVIAGWILFIYFLYHFFSNFNFNTLWTFTITGRWYFLILAVVCSVLMIAAQGLLIKRIFNFYDIQISIFEAIFLWLQLVAAGIISSGILSPLILLKRIQKSNIKIAPASKILSVFYIYYFIPILLFILAVFLTTGVPTIFAFQSIRQRSIIDLMILIFIVVIFIVFKRNKYWLNFWQSFKELRSGVHLEQKILALLISVSEQIFNLGILIFLLLAFGVHIEFIAVIKILAIIELIAIVAPSGGGVGFVDFALVLAFRLVNVNHQEALMLTLIYRSINLWIPAIFGGSLLIINSQKLLSVKKMQ